MQLRPEQLATHLQKPLAPLYVLHGDEPLLVIEAGDAIRACARKQGYGEREVIVASANFRWDDLFLSAGNLSLFGGNKLVDLRIPSGKPGREGSEALQRYAKSVGSGSRGWSRRPGPADGWRPASRSAARAGPPHRPGSAARSRRWRCSSGSPAGGR